MVRGSECQFWRRPRQIGRRLQRPSPRTRGHGLEVNLPFSDLQKRPGHLTSLTHLLADSHHHIRCRRPVIHLTYRVRALTRVQLLLHMGGPMPGAPRFHNPTMRRMTWPDMEAACSMEHLQLVIVDMIIRADLLLLPHNHTRTKCKICKHMDQGKGASAGVVGMGSLLP